MTTISIMGTNIVIGLPCGWGLCARSISCVGSKLISALSKRAGTLVVDRLIASVYWAFSALFRSLSRLAKRFGVYQLDLNGLYLSFAATN